MSFITATQIEITKLLSIYSACSKDEQSILQVLSVIDKTINITNFKLILNKLCKTELEQFKGLKLDKLCTPAFRVKLQRKGLLLVSSKGLKVPTSLAPSLVRLSVSAGYFADIVREAELVTPVNNGSFWGEERDENEQRKVRDRLYLERYDECEAKLKINKNPQIIIDANSLALRYFCFYPFAHDQYIKLSDSLKYQAFAQLLYDFRKNLIDSSEIVALLHTLNEQGHCCDNMRLLLAEQYLQTNELSLAERLLSSSDESAYAYSLRGWLAFLQQQPKASVALYQQAQQAKNKIARRKYPYIGGVAGIYYCLALLQLGHEQDPTYYELLLAETKGALKERTLDLDEAGVYQHLSDFASVLSAKNTGSPAIAFYYYHTKKNYYYFLRILFSLLAEHWTDRNSDAKNWPVLAGFLTESVNNKDPLLNTAAQLLLLQTHYKKPENQLGLDTYQFPHLLNIIKVKEPWDQALDKLLALAPAANNQSLSTLGNTDNSMRMIWLIDPDCFPYSIVPKEQKTTKRGGWTKGRSVSLKRLYEEVDSFSYLTAEDKKICQAIKLYQENYSWSRYGNTYELEGYKALQACIAHPQLYLENDLGTPIELIEHEPEILLTEHRNGFKIKMLDLPRDIDEAEHSFCHLSAETRHRYKLVNFDQQQLKVASILGSAGITVPKAAKDKVINSIKALAPLMNIQSELAEVVGVDVTQVDVDPSLYININRQGDGLELECHFQPLGENGPSVLPGIGNQRVFADRDGERITAKRNLKKEKQALKQLETACPLFSYMSEHRLYLDELEEALTVLEQLDLLQQQQSLPLVLQWPQGESLKIKARAEKGQMQLSLAKAKDWFAIEGELQISDSEVIDLKNLLTLVQDAPGRFIPLGNDQFLTLTSEFKQQLSQLARSTQNGQFHALAAPVIEDLTDGMVVKTNKAWQTQLKKIKSSYKIKPQVPSTLQASLRDYQQEGYDWASRLAHWGAGACLADDMGLGKTLQALAVILSRASQGPSLVLAPTSVCFNWQEEALRFAPSLQVKHFGFGSKSEREAMLAEACEFDVIVCSYGLLQTQGDQLAKIHWQTIIADEAQAIKNPLAKRSKAAMKLNAEFKMITTGTPIENNLTELWSLFQFINPGLLGSIQQFNSRFAKAIENNDKDNKQEVTETSHALRKLISPFILRRLKADVLTELPSRTEINLHVELSPQEVAFYEALRQKALENLLESSDKPGQKRIKVLAEIMKLRRACCNPALVLPETQIGSAKLAAFDELVDELRQGNHKALVFSQFVGHLTLLREHLDKKGVSYQYLDGSTPAVKRKKVVNAFQNGEGDLFLISLKAGGSGLNLTAADYVIHMDPWWNPAVEDQASDRAHRMGQTRPVTIYRLIAQHTIEDKIVAMHQQKRDLANNLLEGSESSGNISLDDLMTLLKPE